MESLLSLTRDIDSSTLIGHNEASAPPVITQELLAEYDQAIETEQGCCELEQQLLAMLQCGATVEQGPFSLWLDFYWLKDVCIRRVHLWLDEEKFGKVLP